MSHVCNGLCGFCCLPRPDVGPRATRLRIWAADRRHMPSLIDVRKALEDGFNVVEVCFDDGATPCTYTKADLPAIYRKITYSM